MKNHTKIYRKALGLKGDEWTPCEVCGGTAVDIHHIESRGMGGNKNADHISNLMGLCRTCHIEYGDKVQHLNFLQLAHRAFLLQNIP